MRMKLKKLKKQTLDDDNFMHAQTPPRLWADCSKCLHVWWGRRLNQGCKIQGSWARRPGTDRSSPLQKCQLSTVVLHCDTSPMVQLHNPYSKTSGKSKRWVYRVTVWSKRCWLWLRIDPTPFPPLKKQTLPQRNYFMYRVILTELQRIELKSHETRFWRHQVDKPATYLSTVEAVYYCARDYHQLMMSATDEYQQQYDDLMFFFIYFYRKIHAVTAQRGRTLKAYTYPRAKRPLKVWFGTISVTFCTLFDWFFGDHAMMLHVYSSYKLPVCCRGPS